MAERESLPDGFDFDEESIVALLDTFVAEQTGPQAKRISHPPDPSDAGAQAAQRTVFQHTSRHEALPLVGETPATRKRRITLLNALANSAVGSARARLLTSAAELSEQLGDMDTAEQAYSRALTADARDVVVLRALRRHAMRRREWAPATEALEREAALDLSPDERASALKLLAHLQLWKLRDSAAAEQAAARAVEIRPNDFVTLLLLAAARLARGDISRAAEAIAEAAACWPEPDTQAVVLLHAAQLMERAAEHERARELYEQALQLHPDSLTARLGLIRAARELGETVAAVEALSAAAERSPTAMLAAVFRRAAGAATSRLLGQNDEAIALLDGADDTASIWTLIEIAALAGDLQAATQALDTDGADETDQTQAVCKARLARFYAELDQHHAWKDASGVMVEDSLRAYVQAAERLSTPKTEGGDELRLLLEAMTEEPQSIIADVIGADDAARAGDGAAFYASLERELSRTSGELELGAALALAEIADEAGLTSRRTALLRAKERSLGHPLVGRALSLLDADDPEACAELWTEEGAETSGARSAFAHMMAARLWPRGSTASAVACEAALQEKPDYWPALWELEDSPAPDPRRAQSAAKQAGLAPTHAASAWLRASMWTDSKSDRSAHAQAAIDPEQPDPLLIEHLFESVGIASEAAGDLMLLAARHFDSVPYLKRAAASYGSAGLPGQAAKALREASLQAPEDEAIRVHRKEAELQAAEFARVADAAMSTAREATDESERLGAFSAMAEVDRLARRDMQSARLSLQSIGEMRPDHVPTARALEWDSLRERDTERTLSSARRLLQALPRESADRVARHRLMLEVLKSDPDIVQSEIDHFLRGIDDPFDADPGLARQLLGAAYAKDDTTASHKALAAIQSRLEGDLERGALALETAHVLERQGDPEQALSILDAAKGHPLALEGEAQLLHVAKRWEEAAAVYQQAAAQAKDGRRAASLWRAAGCIFEDELDNPALAIDAYVSATECDITYLDVYRRLASLYRDAARLDDLAALTESRIEAGADTPTLVQLLIEQAGQRRELGNVEGVIESLRECLELDPNHFGALKELVDSHREQEEWQSATEGLIRIARLKRNDEEQCWAFSQLADIYFEQLRDLPRAEAALRQALKLAPVNVETLDRLASVLSLQGKAQQAARVLEELVRLAGSDAQDRDYRIRLAFAIESTGKARQAELALERLRVEQTTNVDVILALADHYDRQGAARAAAMHLNRAAADLRAALDVRPEDEALWTTLVRVLERRHGPGPASCAASAAIAVGHPASLFSGGVTTAGEALGQPHVPLSNLVDNIVAPRGLPQTARRLFALCEHSFNKVLPFDAGAWRLRRPSGPHRSMIEEAGAIAEIFGISEPRVKVTYVAPIACMPILGDPPTLVIGGGLHELATPEERVFLFARALKVASNHLAPALRASPEELDAALLALLQVPQAGHSQRPAQPQMQDLRRKLIRAVPRRWRDEVESLVLELRGNADFSSRTVPFAIAELGNRVALTLTGDVPSAVNALLKIGGRDVPAVDSGRLEAIRQTPEAWSLVRFAISDSHFEARTQAGVDL